MSNEELFNNLRQNQLYIANEIKRICELENINYFLIYGSLLGAVRHDGFIPWDDDFDIGMLRKDYEKFVKVFNKHASNNTFFMENINTEKNFGLTFTKIKLNNTIYLENSIKNASVHKGIYVDVFPFDNVEYNSKGKIKKSFGLQFLYKLLKFKLKYLPMNPNIKCQLIISKLFYFIGFFINKKLLLKIITSKEKYYMNKKTKYVCYVGSPYKFRDVLLREDLEKLSNHKFENYIFPIPRNFDRVLSTIYGIDYMKLPPKKDRNTRHFPQKIQCLDCDKINDTIRILHSVSRMDRAGVETMLMNYYRNIDKKQIQFDFLCNKGGIGKYDDEIYSMGGKIFHTSGMHLLHIFNYLNNMKMLFVEHPEYKVLHCHNGAFSILPLYCAKRSGIPIRIVHAHGTKIIKDNRYLLKKLSKKFIKCFANNFWSCGSDAACFYYGKKILNKSNYYFLPNAIDVDKFLYNNTIREKIRKQYNIEDKYVIGHVGRFMAQKNHVFLINVFERFLRKNPNSLLVLLGDGELMNKIKNIVKEKGINESVIFVGNVSNVNEWYQAFDMFVLPSIYEGLPVVGIEAQSSGLPCVFSDKVTKEVDISNNCKFIDLNISIEKWSDALVEFSKIHIVRDNMREIIKNNKYSIIDESEKLVLKYIDLLKKINE